MSLNQVFFGSSRSLLLSLGLLAPLTSGTPAHAQPVTERGPVPAAAAAPSEAPQPAPLQPRPAVSQAPAPRKDGGFGLVPLVLPAYQPETSGLLGAAAMLVYEQPKGSGLRDSQVIFAGSASLKKQFSSIVQPDLFLLRDALHISGTAAFSRFPDTFYGIGNDTRSSDAERYTADFYEAELSPKLRLFQGFYLGPTARVHKTTIVATQPGGQIDTHAVHGSTGGLSVMAGLSAFHDSRDGTIYPRSGHIVRTWVRFARHELGSDFDYTTFRFDARQYITLYGKHVLALQAVAHLQAGQPPFYELGRMGGSEIMRGYFEGRFRGRFYFPVQAEYRFPIVWRLGGVAFASAGYVTQHLDHLRARDVRTAAGGGLRLAPFDDLPVNFRVDVAYGNETSAYVSVGEAF